MALEHAYIHAKLKGEDHYVEMRNALVRINSLADVERIIHAALNNPETFEESAEDAMDEARDSELDLSCVC